MSSKIRGAALVEWGKSGADLGLKDFLITQELPKSTPKEPVERQGNKGGYSLGLGSP